MGGVFHGGVPLPQCTATGAAAESPRDTDPSRHYTAVMSPLSDRPRGLFVVAAVLALLLCCGGPRPAPLPGPPPPSSAGASAQRIDAACALPTQPETVRRDGASVLEVWQFAAEEVFFRSVLPDDPGLHTYRAAVRADGADVVEPVADEPTGDAEIWRRERHNSRLAHDGKVGRIRPIECLEALIFAHQHNRFSQLDNPTEFILSVLRKESEGRLMLTLVFGAGGTMFPDKRFYGFDVVDGYLARGWSFWYVLHNHTLQANGERLALGNPVLSTSDVQLLRGLGESRSLAGARVTNGFYTFEIESGELGRLQSRD